MNRHRDHLTPKEITIILEKALHTSVELRKQLPILNEQKNQLFDLSSTTFSFNYSFFNETEGVINAIYFINLQMSHHNTDQIMDVADSSSLKIIHDENIENDDEKNMELVLKVNTLDDAWKKAKTINEVSLLLFLKKNNIMVPQLYDYELDSSSVGFEYLLMEKVKGVTLRSLCYKMDVDDRKHWIGEISKFLKEMNKFTIDISTLATVEGDENVRHVHNVKLTPNCDNKKWYGGSFMDLQLDSHKENLVHVTIGPYVDSRRGPFESFVEYLKSLIEFRYEIFKENENGRFARYIPLLKKYVDKYLNIQHKEQVEMENLKLYICHGDLSTSNVIVNPETKTIVSVIDWEWAKLSVIEEDMRNIYEDWCIEVHELINYFNQQIEDQHSSITKNILDHFHVIDNLSGIENYKQFHSISETLEAEEYVEMISKETDELLTRLIEEN